MKIRETLTSIVLAGALALGTAGCGNHSEYVYDGKIGEDQVKFTEKIHVFTHNHNILTVTKSDGRVIRYLDLLENDLKLEYVEITTKEKTIVYTAYDKVGKPILEEAQKQFDAYTQLIIKTRTDQGLENLK